MGKQKRIILDWDSDDLLETDKLNTHSTSEKETANTDELIPTSTERTERVDYLTVVKSPYDPYILIKENLEEHYFPPGVLGFARLDTGQGVILPTLYGKYRSVVKLHEKLHLMHKSYSESQIRGLTNHLMRYGYAR